MLEEKKISSIRQLENRIREEVQRQAQQSSYQFTGPMKLEEFVSHIFFLLYKDYYIDNMPRHSIGTYGDDPGFKRQFGRGIVAMAERQREDNKRLGIPKNPYLDRVLEKSKRESNVSASYQVNASDLSAIMSYPRNTSNLELVPIMSSGRIVSSKNGTSNAEIYRAYQEYCATYHRKAGSSNCSEWMDAFVDLANLEAKLFPGFLYAVAKYIGTAGIKKVPKHLMILCGQMPIRTGSFQSRFLHHRNAWIPMFFSKSFDELADVFLPLFQLHMDTYLPMQNDNLVKSLLSQISIAEAKEYLEKHYNLFDDCYFPETADGKAWDPKITKALRKVAAVLTEAGYQYSKSQTSVPRSK